MGGLTIASGAAKNIGGVRIQNYREGLSGRFSPAIFSPDLKIWAVNAGMEKCGSNDMVKERITRSFRVEMRQCFMIFSWKYLRVLSA